jgi:hypothetical protein
MLVVLQAFEDPDQSYQEQSAVDKNESIRKHKETYVVKSFTVHVRVVYCEKFINKQGHTLQNNDNDGHDRHFASNSPCPEMSFVTFVSPSKHFRYLKVTEGE